MQCHLPSSRTGAASLASGSSSSSLDKLKKNWLVIFPLLSSLLSRNFSLFIILCSADNCCWRNVYMCHSTPPEREGSLSLGFLLFLCVGFFRSRCWIWTECRALWTGGYANGIVHWLIENVTTEMTTNQTLQSSALLSTFGLYSLGKPWCLSSGGGTWCLLHTSLATGAYLTYYCLSVTVLFWPLPSSSHSGPENCHLLILIFLFSQFPVNPRVGEKIPVRPVCEIHRGTNECKSPF